MDHFGINSLSEARTKDLPTAIVHMGSSLSGSSANLAQTLVVNNNSVMNNNGMFSGHSSVDIQDPMNFQTLFQVSKVVQQFVKSNNLSIDDLKGIILSPNPSDQNFIHHLIHSINCYCPGLDIDLIRNILLSDAISGDMRDMLTLRPYDVPKYIPQRTMPQLPTSQILLPQMQQTQQLQVPRLQVPQMQVSQMPSSYAQQQAHIRPQMRPANNNPGVYVVEPTETKSRGPFAFHELEALDRFTKSFLAAHGFTEADLQRGLWTKPLPDVIKKGYLSQLYQVLPERNKKSVYHHIRRKYNPFERRGIWTREEDEQLRDLVAEKGYRWAEIGSITGRMPEDVRDRFRNYHKNPTFNKGEWSKEEDMRLLDILTQYRKDFPNEPVSFSFVGMKMGTRSRLQCINRANSGQFLAFMQQRGEVVLPQKLGPSASRRLAQSNTMEQVSNSQSEGTQKSVAQSDHSKKLQQQHMQQPMSNYRYQETQFYQQSPVQQQQQSVQQPPQFHPNSQAQQYPMQQQQQSDLPSPQHHKQIPSPLPQQQQHQHDLQQHQQQQQQQISAGQENGTDDHDQLWLIGSK